ncbi:hypothetical protein TNIN_467221 [Trichonephila inaurata madagascariensis]|uniref:Uncharacterized protein n=1 Tax=Trichonephila inaurata madagascariensis TaxID=2747483 RepID=A0A8X6XX23_9ARAC|nr:hypothetical protein TNIN_467221 [Trichonephila inaurata madagascariensis]
MARAYLFLCTRYTYLTTHALLLRELKPVIISSSLLVFQLQAMNDYTKRLVKAALRFTGKPVTLSPMLNDSYGEFERCKLSSDPVDFRVILNVDCLAPPEVKIQSDAAGVQVRMQHNSRELTEGLKWSRDCTYSYKMPESPTCSTENLAAYWTEDQFLVIQPRGEESVYKGGCDVFHLLPIQLINFLQPRLDDKFIKEGLEVVMKKVREVHYYVRETAEVPEKNDILSLLKCVPILNESDLIAQRQKEIAGTTDSSEGSEEDSSEEESSEGESTETLDADVPPMVVEESASDPQQHSDASARKDTEEKSIRKSLKPKKVS